MVSQNVLSLVAFLGGGSLVASLAIGSFKKLWQDVEARWGALVTQIALLVVCILISGVAWAFQFLPTNIMAASAEMFAGAIVLYEVGYKAIWQNAISNKTV